MLFQSRAKRLRKQALLLDMEYHRRVGHEYFPHLQMFDLILRKSYVRINHLLHHFDEEGCTESAVFELYTRRGKRSYRQTVFYLISDYLWLPEFKLRQSGVGGHIQRWVGIPDIDFELYPRFSRRYKLTGEPEASTRYLMNDEVLTYFNAEPGWTMEGVKNHFVLYQRGKRQKVDAIPDFYRQGMALYQSFLRTGSKDYV
jgi:hypothetical protein